MVTKEDALTGIHHAVTNILSNREYEDAVLRHGDPFGPALGFRGKPCRSCLADAESGFIQPLDPARRYFLERFDTVWLRLSSKVASGALGYGKTLHAQRVFCGHTHEAMQVKRDGVEYFNSGSWTQQRATYITIDSTGVTIHDYEERIDDNYSGEERSETDSEFAALSHSSGLSADLEYENIPG